MTQVSPQTARPTSLAWLGGALLLAAGCSALPASHDRLPIAPARTLTVETSEGTAMSVDLSPDGRTLVFDLLGDLYTLPLAGGRATQLTRGLALDRRPVWSPDGRQIAFISDATGAETLWLMNADGTHARPVAPERPVPEGALGGVSSTVGATLRTSFIEAEWLPAGPYLASDDTLYSPAGSEPPRPLGLGAQYARFSPDGRYVYFIRADTTTRSSFVTRFRTSGGVRRYDRTTGATTELAPDLTDILPPAVSPDGTWLAYVRRDTLWVRYLATGADRRLAAPLQGSRRLAFTPDSRALILGYGGKLHRIEVTTGADAVIPFTARARVDLGPFVYHRYRLRNDALRVRYIRSPALSPDGKTLVFSALQRLYVMALPAGKPRPLLAAEETGQFQPTFSPDGRWIAYVTWSDSAGGHVWRVPATGGRPERLTAAPGYYQRPAWAPDGTTLAVLKSGTGTSWPAEVSPGSLLLLPSTGGPLRSVASDAWPVTAASFSADGRRLFFLTRERAPGYFGVLLSVRLDGSERRVVARTAHGDEFPMGIVPSPDGRYLAFATFQQLYLARASTTSEPVTLDAAAAVQLSPQLATDAHWSPDGRTLTWVVANRVFRLEPDRVMTSEASGATLRRAAPVPAQGIAIDLRVPRHTAHGTLALRGARVITMRGAEVLENATVVITDDRITAVGPTARVVVPAGATVLDVSGTTLMPGLVDLHAHLDTPHDEYFSRYHWPYLVNLAYGVTTARGVSEAFEQFGDGELIEAGGMLGPRLCTAGPAFQAWLNGAIESLAEARAVVGHRKAMGGVVIKMRELRTRREQAWVARAADEARLNVTDHNSLERILDGLTGVEHRDYGVPVLYRDVIRLRAQARTWHTPTFVTGRQIMAWGGALANDRKYRRFTPAALVQSRGWDKPVPPQQAAADEHFLQQLRSERFAARLVQGGGHVTMGSHGNHQGIGAHWEMWALQLSGLTNHEVLRAATLQGAAGLGMQQDLGSIEVGKIADLLVLDKNPLEDIRHTLPIRYVMKNGILYDGDTLDPRWPEQRALPAWMYQEAGQTAHAP